MFKGETQRLVGKGTFFMRLGREMISPIPQPLSHGKRTRFSAVFPEVLLWALPCEGLAPLLETP